MLIIMRPLFVQSSLLRPVLLVWRRPLDAAVIITAAEDEVKLSSAKSDKSRCGGSQKTCYFNQWRGFAAPWQCHTDVGFQ